MNRVSQMLQSNIFYNISTVFHRDMLIFAENFYNTVKK